LSGADVRGWDKWWADRFASAEVTVRRDVWEKEVCGAGGWREWEWTVIKKFVCA
jgi:hypothetical protein